LLWCGAQKVALVQKRRLELELSRTRASLQQAEEMLLLRRERSFSPNRYALSSKAACSACLLMMARRAGTDKHAELSAGTLPEYSLVLTIGIGRVTLITCVMLFMHSADFQR
jgi:hypothetical protein